LSKLIDIVLAEVGHTDAASALRILTFLWNIAWFMKQNEAAAIAMVTGIATKLKTLWFCISWK
jgi:hypothetical protein